ncbi:MAG: RND transporter, partial [Gammaproteobacteria bacterium]|nr:RND transporter [Gammaproteobacteria bacterium]
QWVIRWRWLLIAGSIGIVLLAGSGVRLLEFHNNYRMFFSEDNPQLIAFENLQDTYTKNDNVLLVLEPRSGSVFTRELLSVLEKITEQAWQIPYSNRVDSITNFQYTYADGDDLIVEDLVRNAQDLNDVDLARIKAAALAEPLLERRLVSPQADVTGVNVTIQLPDQSLTEVPEVAGFVQKMVEDLRANHPQI